MTVNELLKGNSVAQPRLRYGCDSTVISMEAVLHLHLSSIWLKDCRLILCMLLLLLLLILLMLLLNLCLICRVGSDAQILPKLCLFQICVQVNSRMPVIEVLGLLPAERG